mmetsp:Transcript_511/g.2032  ORF Transcript_511/g.2032 Transcript_511/m.2032 type:complete len:217 (+) Transcript_511:238-888(+)
MGRRTTMPSLNCSNNSSSCSSEDWEGMERARWSRVSDPIRNKSEEEEGGQDQRRVRSKCNVIQQPGTATEHQRSSTRHLTCPPPPKKNAILVQRVLKHQQLVDQEGVLDVLGPKDALQPGLGLRVGVALVPANLSQVLVDGNELLLTNLVLQRNAQALDPLAYPDPQREVLSRVALAPRGLLRTWHHKVALPDLLTIMDDKGLSAGPSQRSCRRWR